MMDVVVFSVAIGAGAAVVLWWWKPKWREAIERPKYRFQEQLEADEAARAGKAGGQ